MSTNSTLFILRPIDPSACRKLKGIPLKHADLFTVGKPPAFLALLHEKSKRPWDFSSAETYPRHTHLGIWVSRQGWKGSSEWPQVTVGWQGGRRSHRICATDDTIKTMKTTEKVGEISANNISAQISSVAQPCPTLCNPVDRSTPGLPVHYQLLEFTQ